MVSEISEYQKTKVLDKALVLSDPESFEYGINIFQKHAMDISDMFNSIQFQWHFLCFLEELAHL